jgi:hypothetical protein
MNIQEILAELHQERERVEDAIRSVERLVELPPRGRGRPPGWMNEVKTKRRGRPPGSKNKPKAIVGIEPLTIEKGDGRLKEIWLKLYTALSMAPKWEPGR